MNPSEDSENEYDKQLDQLDRKYDATRVKDRDDNRLKVVETVFDEKTRLILFNMINKGMFNEITGAISSGKEANVYYAPVSEDNGIAIKIFRIDTPSFRKMRGYVEGDFRFKKVTSKRSGFIEVWAKKEYKNLSRMYEHSIPVPKPIYVERNILLMEFMGDGENVLPLLKDCIPAKPKKMYKAIMEDVKTIYRKAKLVHADLSEYNILFEEKTDKYYIIDVSQAVLQDHPNASTFLVRDLNNLNRFFKTLGVDVIPLDKIFKWVTGDDIDLSLLLKYQEK